MVFVGPAKLIQDGTEVAVSVSLGSILQETTAFPAQLELLGMGIPVS